MGIAKNPDGVGGLGYGQIFYDMTASKTVGVGAPITYYNTTGKPITVVISIRPTATANIYGWVSGVQITLGFTIAAMSDGIVQLIVPTGASYGAHVQSGGISTFRWFEFK